LKIPFNNKHGDAVKSGVLFAINVFTIGKGGAAKEGAIVIGENMAERVIPASEALADLGATVMPRVENATSGMCAEFVSNAINKGQRVFDVGTELGKSRFYAAEIKAAAKLGLERVRFDVRNVNGEAMQVWEWVKKAPRHQ
jgi:hypothetical protein